MFANHLSFRSPRKYELYEIVQYINRVTNRDATNGYGLSDMRFNPLFWLRVYMTEFARKNPIVCWEKIEKECVSDVLTPGNPTLEDLGVKLSYFEQMARFHGNIYDRFGYYHTDYGEVPPPELPKYVPISTQ